MSCRARLLGEESGVVIVTESPCRSFAQNAGSGGQGGTLVLVIEFLPLMGSPMAVNAQDDGLMSFSAAC